jgi:hypothetical protein
MIVKRNRDPEDELRELFVRDMLTVYPFLIPVGMAHGGPSVWCVPSAPASSVAALHREGSLAAPDNWIEGWTRPPRLIGSAVTPMSPNDERVDSIC